MLGQTAITNSEDIIDSRSMIERIDYLEIDYEDPDEVAELKEVIDNLRSYGGASPEDGITLIRDSYFRTYAEELADDIGAIDSNASWPIYHIDWEAAANELKMDYSTLEWDGITFWYR